jgi:hypothetical protein
LAAVAVALAGVFAVAAWIRPYGTDGRPLQMETHTQLGLPPCTFYRLTGLPCPSCGMTTSFALLVHGDLWNSLCANAVGTMLAAFCLALIPWCIASAIGGRLLWVTALDRTLTWLVLAFVVLMLVRWAIVLGFVWGAHGRDGGNIDERHRSRRYDDGSFPLRTTGGACGSPVAHCRLRPDVAAVFSERRRLPDQA